MTLSRSPQCRAFSRALMDEKSLSPLFPIGGGGQWLQMTGALSHPIGNNRELSQDIKEKPKCCGQRITKGNNY